jgi:hypothetical protein
LRTSQTLKLCLELTRTKISHSSHRLLYTVDTAFHTESQMVAPLKLVSLGMFASEKSRAKPRSMQRG